MGLDLFVAGRPVSSFSYIAFDELRERLAASIGLDLNIMIGFGGTTPWETVDDPLVTLLDHDDDGGEIGSEACGRLADRLAEVTRN